MGEKGKSQNLVYRVDSRTTKATQTNPVSKNKTKTQNLMLYERNQTRLATTAKSLISSPGDGVESPPLTWAWLTGFLPKDTIWKQTTW